MRLICAVLATGLVLSCGGDKLGPTPTQPSVPTPPTTPAFPAPTFAVSGTVRDDRGAPVADAQVYGGCLSCKGGPLFGMKTSAAGGYSGRLPAGTWELMVTKAGFERQTKPLRVSGDTTFDVALKPGVMVLGRTFEEGVGPLIGVRIEVLTGPNAGLSTTTNPPGVAHAFSLQLLPGEHRLRASKDGYDPVERIVSALADVHNVDFTLKWAYGSCLSSVAPVFFNGYRSAGGEEVVAVDVMADKTWTATPDQPWITVTSPSQQSGSGRVTMRILPHAPGAVDVRSGALMIRCSASEGQNVWVVQKPDCQVRLTPHADTPAVFPASGGTGRLSVRTGVAACRWKAEGAVDWIYSVGINERSGDYDYVTFVVRENLTGAMRTGSFVVGETVWPVTQQR